MRPIRLISCLTIVGTLIAFAAVPASAAVPTITATPNTNLADGQTISVEASGFAANTEMAVVECPGTVVSPATCDLNTVVFVTTNPTGAYPSVAFTVSRILSDGTDCALSGGCYIGTQDSEGAGGTAATKVTFDPSIPPLPKLELAIRVDKTPKVNDKGVVIVRGKILCKNKGADVEVELGLRQIYNRAIFQSTGFTLVSCAANSAVPFNVTLRPENGLFGPGPAVVNVGAFAGDLFVIRRAEVNLVGHHRSGARASAPARLAWK
jgi:Neocarzinostatin family